MPARSVRLTLCLVLKLSVAVNQDDTQRRIWEWAKNSRRVMRRISIDDNNSSNTLQRQCQRLVVNASEVTSDGVAKVQLMALL
jgi:hypothetical protein